MNLGASMGDYGSGSVYQRGDVWYVDFYVNGDRRRIATDAQNKTEAKAVRDREREAARGANARPGGPPTYEDAEQALIADYARKGNRSNPEKRLKHLRPTFGGRTLASIGARHIDAYATYRVKHEGAAPATVNRELACLRRMFHRMRELDAIDAVPHFPMRQEQNVRTGFIGEDELQLILKHIRPELHGLVEFAYVTGWRKGEILSRDWSHVTDRAIRLEPGQTKNDEGREFPLIPRIARIIEAQRDRMDGKIGGPLFFWTPGRRIKSFKESWQSAVEAAGLPDLLFHDLRRSAVRNLVLAGIDEHTAMKLTGHKTRSVFDRYDIVDSARLHEQASKLEAFYGQTERKMRAING